MRDSICSGVARSRASWIISGDTTLQTVKPEQTFVPAVIDAMPDPDPAPRHKPTRRRRRGKASTVELEVDGITVKIGCGADAGTISAVITALRETR